MELLLDTITAFSGLAATVVALVLLRQGQQDRQRLRIDDRRRQAQSVTAWCDWNANSAHVSEEHPWVPAVFVRNTSNQAVYQTFVDYHDPDTEGLVRVDIGPVPPGETRSRDIPTKAVSCGRWEPSMLSPRLFFEDSYGYAWMRDTKGRLRSDPGPGNDGFFQAGGHLRLGVPRPDSPD